MQRKAIRTTKYDNFKGVDFSTDPTLVDGSHSPWAPNLISDLNGVPEKRAGWKEIRKVDDRINGIHDSPYFELLIHAGTKLYMLRTTGGIFAQVYSQMNDADSVGVVFGGNAFIFDGANVIQRCADEEHGTYVRKMSEAAYVPLTVIARDPAGGGVSYEAINMAGGGQRVGFLADGTSTDYILPYDEVDSIDKVIVNGEEQTSGWTAIPESGVVRFDAAPSAPAAGAEDNVEIWFTRANRDYYDRINKCRIAFVWGANGQSDRIIASGNPQYPNYDFISAFGDATYWPDTGYSVIGSDRSPIVGYRRLGEYLAIIKRVDGRDSKIFIRTSAVSADGETVFPVKPAIADIGAISRYGFGHIGDEQLFLSSDGVYALTTNSLTAERVAQNRSVYVNAKMKTHSLNQAKCCSWNGCFLVFIGGCVYGLDGRQARRYTSRNDTSFVYECFYWEDIPARCVLNVKDYFGRETLYFGTSDGRLCRFKFEDTTLKRFCDEYSEDGETVERAIAASWATKSDDDGDPMIHKTMLKKGNSVTLKPYHRSGARIAFRTDKDAVAWQAAEGTVDIFDWTDIDFSRFTFDANDGPREIPFNRKVKKYKRLQIIVGNDEVNEGFGIHSIVKHFVAGNFAKT